MVHLHHQLDRNKAVNKFMLIAIISLLSVGGFLLFLLFYMRKIQKELILSEMKAQEANDAKSDFLANMSHEIRTPMNGVLGMTQLLERTPLTSQQSYYLDIVKHSGTILLDLINDILDFSKIEADKLILNYNPCNLDKMLQDVVDLLTPNADEKGVNVRYNFAPDIPKYLLLDKKRTRQVVVNLIGNAIKFTPKGHVDVRVEGHFDNGRGTLKICVSDTGIGIEPEQLNQIFEKFTQAGSDSNRIGGGTGLGLAISHKLTKAMRGQLSVVSTLNVGSSFTLDLPTEMVAPEFTPKYAPKALHPTLAA